MGRGGERESAKIGNLMHTWSRSMHMRGARSEGLATMSVRKRLHRVSCALCIMLGDCIRSSTALSWAEMKERGASSPAGHEAALRGSKRWSPTSCSISSPGKVDNERKRERGRMSATKEGYLGRRDDRGVKLGSSGCKGCVACLTCRPLLACRQRSPSRNPAHRPPNRVPRLDGGEHLLLLPLLLLGE